MMIWKAANLLKLFKNRIKCQEVELCRSNEFDQQQLFRVHFWELTSEIEKLKLKEGNYEKNMRARDEKLITLSVE